MQSLFSPLLQLRTFFLSISAANCHSGDRILAPLFHSGRSSNREGKKAALILEEEESGGGLLHGVGEASTCADDSACCLWG